MKKHFYHHIITLDSLIVELNSMRLSEAEKEHLASIAYSSLHYAVLDTILSELAEEDKKTFLDHVSSPHHEKTWKFVKQKIENVEEKIKKAAYSLEEELKQDIKELRNK